MRVKLRQIVGVVGAVLLNIVGSLCQIDECGQAPLNKIVAGQNAPGSWPWQASLQRISTSNHFCGASLINKDWVLSAAHCFQFTATADVKVSLGRQLQIGSNPHEISITVTQVIIHPSYSTMSQNNDIALLQLSSSVTFTDYIRPVCLAAADSVFAAGTKSWVTGWGKLHYADSTIQNALQEVQIPVVNNSVCTAGWERCMSESGGPMVSKEGSLWIQSGIVSFGRDCGLPNFPGVYTRVSQYQSWINSQIGRNLPGFVSFTSTESRSGSPSRFLSFLPLTMSIIPLTFSLYVFS